MGIFNLTFGFLLYLGEFEGRDTQRGLLLFLGLMMDAASPMDDYLYIRVVAWDILLFILLLMKKSLINNKKIQQRSGSFLYLSIDPRKEKSLLFCLAHYSKWASDDGGAVFLLLLFMY